MGIVGYIEESLAKKFKDIIEESSNIFGFVIAQRTDSSVHLTHLVPFSDNGTADKNKSLSSITDSYISAQADQVVRMLPGGLEIMGMYLILPNSTLKDHQLKLKSLLSAVRKTTLKYYLGCYEFSKEMILLCGEPKTSEVGLKSLNVADGDSSHMEKIILKVEPTFWHCLNFNYLLTYSIYFPIDCKMQSLRKSVLTEMEPWAESLEDSLFLLEGKRCPDDETLVSWPTSSKSTKKSKSNSSGNEVTANYQVQILEEKKKVSQESAGVQKYSGSVVFSGTVSGRAYVVTKISYSDALNAVRKDLIRSFVSRWQMHCDSLVEEPLGSSQGFDLHEPPRRVFVKENGNSITLCDYLFPGDSVSDTCHSVREVFGISVSPDNIDDSLETWADPEEFEMPNMETENPKENECLERVFWFRRSISVQIGAAVLTGLLAIFLSYLLISRQ